MNFYPIIYPLAPNITPHLKSKGMNISCTNLDNFPGSLSNYKNEIIQVFSKAVKAKSFVVYLFGSRARSDEFDGSDVDIAIQGNEITVFDLSRIREQWEYSTIPLQLDLVDMKEIGSSLSQQIIKERIPLWTSN